MNQERTEVKLKGQRVNVTARIPARVRQEVARLAKRKFKTVSGYVADLVIDHVREKTSLGDR